MSDCCCSPLGPPTPAPASLVPLSTFLFVDSASASLTPNGAAVTHQYPTVQAALDDYIARGTDLGGTVGIASYQDAATHLTAGNLAWAIFQQLAGAALGDGTQTAAPSFSASLGPIVGNGTLRVVGCKVSGDNGTCPPTAALTSATASVELAGGAIVNGAIIALVALRGSESTLLGDTDAPVQVLESCSIGGNLTASTSLELRNCQFTAAVTISTPSLTWDTSSLRAAAAAGVLLTNVSTIVDLDDIPPIYGAGYSGNLTTAAGSTTVGASQYKKVTISGTARVELRSDVLYVQNILDLSAAPLGAVVGRANVGANTSGFGGAAAGITGGTAGGAQSARPNTMSGSLAGTAGANGDGVTGGAGVAATAPTSLSSGSGGGGGGTGASGAGGGGLGKAGVAAQAAGGYSEPRTVPNWNRVVATGLFNTTVDGFWGGQSGRGGSSGGGDTVNGGGGGGGGGAGGHTTIIYAKYVKLGAATPAQVIATPGSGGGLGGNGAGGTAGGGSGGGGGGGGFLQVVYDYVIDKTAPVVAGLLDARGGTGGTGGNGVTTGAGGAGGNGGAGGLIIAINRLTGARNLVNGSAGTNGAAATGATGGAGGAGGACSGDFA